MSGLSRRTFLTRGSIALAAGGAVAAVPGLHTLLETSPAGAAESNGALTQSEASAAGSKGPLVAQVTDINKGEITVYQGQSMVVLRDPSVVARLHRSMS